jgi:hypothetical protein
VSGDEMIDTLKGWFEGLAHAVRGAGLWWGIAISVSLAVVSLVVAGAIVVSWSPHHFKGAKGSGFWPDRPAPVRVLGLVGKNLAGVVMILLGFVMSLPGIPGQGIITMIIGLTLVDFPGKRGLERRLLGRPFVFRTLNRLRARFHKPPLDLGA